MIELCNKQSKDSVNNMIKRVEDVCDSTATQFMNDLMWAVANLQSDLSNSVRNESEKQFLLGQIQVGFRTNDLI